MINFGDYSLDVFKFWILIGQIFVFISFIYSFLSPPLENFYIDHFKRIIGSRKANGKSNTINPKLDEIPEVREDIPDERNMNNDYDEEQDA